MAEESHELREGDDVVEPDMDIKVAEPRRGQAAAAAAKHLAEVAAETSKLAAMDWPTLRAFLRAIVAGTHTASTEALVRICRQAYEVGDRAKVNLSFEALSKTAAPLLLSQAFGQAEDERREQVQEILLQLFAAIRAGKSELAERFFADYAKRRSISLFRKRDALFEGKLERSEPVGDIDPIDTVPEQVASLEARVLLSVAVDKLPPKLRTAFIQYHHFGMTQEEVAEQNQVDVRTVHDWLKKARAALGLNGDENDR
jgi:RNA polymerase sigma factor (sigma-70 family)